MRTAGIERERPFQTIHEGRGDSRGKYIRDEPRLALAALGVRVRRNITEVPIAALPIQTEGRIGRRMQQVGGLGLTCLERPMHALELLELDGPFAGFLVDAVLLFVLASQQLNQQDILFGMEEGGCFQVPLDASGIGFAPGAGPLPSGGSFAPECACIDEKVFEKQEAFFQVNGLLGPARRAEIAKPGWPDAKRMEAAVTALGEHGDIECRE